MVRIIVNGQEFEGDAGIEMKPISGIEPISDVPAPEMSMSVEITGTLTASGFELLSRVYHGEFNA